MCPYSTHSLPVKQQVDNALPAVIKTEQLKHFKYRRNLFMLPLTQVGVMSQQA